jgi:hypothetical protein
MDRTVSATFRYRGEVETALQFQLLHDSWQQDSDRTPVGAKHSSLLQKSKMGSGAHTASYTVNTRGSFPGVKAAGTQN